MMQSGKVLLVFITFTLITNLNCQEDTNTSQVPLLETVATQDGRGSSGMSTGDGTLQPAEEPVVDGPVTEQGGSNETPYVKGIYSLVNLVPDAENAFFTDTGRLFVTGNTGIYEISGRCTRTTVYKDNYGVFAGIAQSGKWLYVICNRTGRTLPEIDLYSLFFSGNILTILNELTDAYMEKKLLRADLSAPGAPVFTEVYTFRDTLIPNGLAADAEGNLYAADETFLPMGKIIKLTIKGDYQPVVTQETWLSYKDGCLSPNGVVIRGDTLYFTDFVITSTKPARVKKVEIINGRPGTVETVYSAASFFDDLDVGIYRNQPHIAVSDYLLNSIILIKENDGTKTRLGSGKFANPSAVHFGAAPYFKTNELIITEKGILYEMYSSYGNKLSCMTISE